MISHDRSAEQSMKNQQHTSTDHDDYRQRLIEFYYPYSLGQGQADVTETQ